MYFYGPVYYDWTYALLIVAMILSMIISARVSSTYKKYAKQAAQSGLTAEQAAQRVLAANGVYGVGFARISGELTDNYNPKTNVISLSDSVYGKSSVAAIGVACHEAGHAVQHATGYGPVKLRVAMVPITNIGSSLAVPLFVIGLLLDFMGLVYIGIALFSLSTLFQLVTLPVEFNASRRALAALDSHGLLSDDELKGAKKVLSAAALTYVAALATSALMLLRYISIAKRRD